MTPLLVALLVLIVAGSWWFATRGEASFSGSDTRITETLQDDGIHPWASPILTLGSSEIESGLFALQAGLGGVLLGYAVGRLHARTRSGTRERTGG